MAVLPGLTPEMLHFALLSFEGPDEYSTTRLVFLGYPSLPAEETPMPKLTLHRWAQWLSATCAAGVYDGEDSLFSAILLEAGRASVTTSGPALSLDEKGRLAGCDRDVAAFSRIDLSMRQSRRIRGRRTRRGPYNTGVLLLT